MSEKEKQLQLLPSYHGINCPHNGENPGRECHCDECDYYLVCFPDWREIQTSPDKN